MVKQFLGLSLIVLLAACGNGADEATEPAAAPTPADESTITDEPETAQPAAATPTAATLGAGTYCYTIGDANQTGAMRLMIDETAQLLGDSSITIHSEEASYYSSYTQSFVGRLNGNSAEVDVTTWIEYDRQMSTETWTVTAETLTLPNDTLVAADCRDEAVIGRFESYDDLDAAALLDGVADQTGQQVQFAPGTSGTTLENSVIRGERDLYILGAQGGQIMTLDLYALEDNAVFDVISPSGSLLVQESVYESIALPEAGDYQIIVGGTRGNATYSLDVTIE